MKNPLDPRHTRRQKLVEDLFRIEFHKQNINPHAKEILSKKEIIDEIIKKAAPEFPIEKINRVDLAILRLAVYELSVEKREPPRAIIDEAVELAKEYGGETSPAFINGALGNIIDHDKSS
jgi:N utilization substance protein B